jgi:hypothetical protein
MRLIRILPLLAWVVVSSAFDMDWYIRPQSWTPVLQQDEDDSPFVLFEYEVPKLNEHKWTDIKLFQEDCFTPATDSSLYAESNLTTDNFLQARVHIRQETIDVSPYWTDAGDGSSGSIQFCLRVDLLLDQESENFHETVRSYFCLCILPLPCQP